MNNQIATFVVLASLITVGSCLSLKNSGTYPTAQLVYPVCVEEGREFVLDASGSTTPTGKIEKFIFQLGHREPGIATRTSIVKMTAPKAVFKDGEPLPVPVTVTVINDEGYRSIAEGKLYVVKSLEQCPSQESSIDVYADIAPETARLEVELTELDVEGWDLLPDDIAHDIDTTASVDVPVEIPSQCVDISGSYHVQVSCLGTIELKFDVVLFQVGCVITEQSGMLEGVVNNNTVSLHSPFADLNMPDCTGTLEQTDKSFLLTCTNQCSAQFVPIL